MNKTVELPGLNCGLCGFSMCEQLFAELTDHPDWIKRCVKLANCEPVSRGIVSPGAPFQILADSEPLALSFEDRNGRMFDFYVDVIDGDPGPREDITAIGGLLAMRELDLSVGDILEGQPIGMSCGCPMPHVGKVMGFDIHSGVITWCVVGPRAARAQGGGKPLRHYSALAYEGWVNCEAIRVDSETGNRVVFRTGDRIYFMPRACMMGWRHTGVINRLKKIGPDRWWIRIEALTIA
jgi:uncharacterized Fe-S cluster-containing protein